WLANGCTQQYYSLQNLLEGKVCRQDGTENMWSCTRWDEEIIEQSSDVQWLASGCTQQYYSLQNLLEGKVCRQDGTENMWSCTRWDERRLLNSPAMLNGWPMVALSSTTVYKIC
ncbi:hypothetical protein J6590_020998, partial [Homalodisca vitripennis]